MSEIKVNIIGSHSDMQLRMQEYKKVLNELHVSLPSTNCFEVSHADNSKIIPVLKSYAVAVSKYINAATTDKYYIDDIFNTFSFRPVEDLKNQKYATMFLMMTDYLSHECKTVAYELHEKLTGLGLKYPSLYGSLQYHKTNRVFGLKYDIKRDCLFGRALLNDVACYIDEIILSTPNIKKPFYKSTCYLCNGTKTVHDKCAHRVVYEIANQTYYNCNYMSFEFDKIEKGDVDSIINLLKI